MAKILKFAITGLAGTIIDFAMFNAVLALTGTASVSRIVGYGFGTLWAFFTHRTWVFKSPTGMSKLLPFLLLYIATGIVAVSIQSQLGPSFGVYGTYVFSVLAAATLNFIGMRFLVFGRSAEASR